MMTWQVRVGLLEDTDSKSHCLAFLRVLANINFSDGSMANHYVDIGQYCSSSTRV